MLSLLQLCHNINLIFVPKLQEMLSGTSTWMGTALFACLTLLVHLKLSNELFVPPWLYLTYNVTRKQRINDRFFKVASCLNIGLMLIKCQNYKYDVRLWGLPLVIGWVDFFRAKPPQEVSFSFLRILLDNWIDWSETIYWICIILASTLISGVARYIEVIFM